MKTSLYERERRRLWAVRNASKVKESNRRYRLGNWAKTTRQARERMRRFRAAKARHNVTQAP